MSAATVVHVLVSGLATGSIYALMAISLVIVYKATRTLNFAQGEMLMVSAFIGWSAHRGLGLPLPLALVAAVVASAALAFAIERVIIRRAIGAKRRDILTQFLVESVVVSALGGIIGILIGVGISQLISGVDFGGQKMQTVVSASSILLAFGVSSAIGVFFGAYPASRAASLNPIEALRYE